MRTRADRTRQGEENGIKSICRSAILTAVTSVTHLPIAIGPFRLFGKGGGFLRF